jgi:hypothetical protein
MGNALDPSARTAAARAGGQRGRRLQERDVTAEIRLGPSGAIVEVRGAAEGLPLRLAYASRMVQVVGELLGLRDFMTLEASVTGGHLFVRAEADGGLSALQLAPAKSRAEIQAAHPTPL